MAKIDEEHRVAVERLKVECSLLEQKMSKQESAHQIAVQHETQKVYRACLALFCFSFVSGLLASLHCDAQLPPTDLMEPRCVKRRRRKLGCSRQQH